MAYTDNHEAKVFDMLKKRKPGDVIKFNDDSGQVKEAKLVRRGRQNARVRVEEEEEEWRLVALRDIVLEEERT